MKETYWGYWLVLLGIFVIGVMLLVNNISTTNTQDYYNIKEVTQASMIDAVDFAYYRLYGTVKMSEQKFVENFVRRFVENVNLANTYDIDFYGIYEVPPKVSVKISTGTRSFNIANTQNDYDVVTTLNAILELGANGDSDSIISSKEGICPLWLGNQLWSYYNGETVDGYSYANDVKNNVVPAVNSVQLAQLRNNVHTFGEFKEWFNNVYTISGQKAEEYFTSHKYAQWEQFLKTFVQRDWIRVH